MSSSARVSPKILTRPLVSIAFIMLCRSIPRSIREECQQGKLPEQGSDATSHERGKVWARMSTFRSPCRALVVGAILSSNAACDMSQDREAEWLDVAQDRQERAEAERAERADAEQALFA